MGLIAAEEITRIELWTMLGSVVSVIGIVGGVLAWMLQNERKHAVVLAVPETVKEFRVAVTESVARIERSILELKADFSRTVAEIRIDFQGHEEGDWKRFDQIFEEVGKIKEMVARHDERLIAEERLKDEAAAKQRRRS